ncbi:hypothetical protein AB0I28_12630 [Phytomonospora sp. NPDC050363]|uniref:phage tail tube protein n=1 Tax=Phytomonospora sp. NPDC050363 TaxID=3155642 RepID=UPI00340C4FF8
MSDIVVDGTVKVWWVPTIANIAAPTLDELAAGIPLETILTRDGLMGFKAETAAVDNTSLASKFDTALAGMASFSGTGLRLKKQTGGDTPYATLTRNTEGNLVIRRSIDVATAAIAAQEVQVYPSICGETSWMEAEKNTTDRYEVPLFMASEPELRAVLAA